MSYGRANSTFATSGGMTGCCFYSCITQCQFSLYALMCSPCWCKHYITSSCASLIALSQVLSTPQNTKHGDRRHDLNLAEGELRNPEFAALVNQNEGCAWFEFCSGRLCGRRQPGVVGRLGWRQRTREACGHRVLQPVPGALLSPYIYSCLVMFDFRG